ncbi:hypothetical protein RB45 [Rhodopirellula baltica SH 1]|uniref:Uncharacterized protein n=1 Tax=Rhodopirellula baltica (strain DSM 10527 / NCIMB 13988 / SH1) TaxID=243090 RepID=Q7UZC6_RHOBA|nr:hypothetical protein RB45 [Rhodopirellula baltica SH 1]
MQRTNSNGLTENRSRVIRLPRTAISTGDSFSRSVTAYQWAAVKTAIDRPMIVSERISGTLPCTWATGTIDPVGMGTGEDKSPPQDSFSPLNRPEHPPTHDLTRYNR